jgi:hypothetical protein
MERKLKHLDLESACLAHLPVLVMRGHVAQKGSFVIGIDATESKCYTSVM